MKKTTTLCIDKLSVFRRVAITTAYMAAKNDEDGNLCDRVPVVQADEELMDELWQESCTAADGLLRAYLLPCQGQQTPAERQAQYRVSLVVRHCSWAGRKPAADALRSFLVADLLWRWLTIVLPEQADAYRQSVDTAAEQLRRYVAAVPHRVRKYTPF